MTPKFRVWLKEEKRMTDVHEMSFIDDEVQMISDVTDFYTYGEFELMQSIGLIDENGKEIFEGDIVHAYGEDTYLVGVIEYFDNAYCIKNKNGIYNSFWINAEQYEIIGNIWEDGELLDS